MKKRRKGIQIALAVLMIVSAAAVLAFTGCGGGDGGPTGNETIKLKYASTLPIMAGYWGSPSANSTTYKWEEAVETVTEGRIDIELYPSETLCKETLAYDAIDVGIADIAWTIAGYAPEWVPLELVWYLPIDMDNLEMNYQIHNHVYEDYLYSDYEKRGMINITRAGREKYIVFSPYKPLYTLEDFVGLTMMASGISVTELANKLGALSVSVTYFDAYEALAKGAIECAILDVTLPILFNWHEVGDPGYIIDVGGFGNAMPTYTAKADLLDRLRPEDAYAVLKLTDYWSGVYSGQAGDASNHLYWLEIPKLGMEIIIWDESEKERLRVLKREVYDWWIEWMEDEYGRGEQAEELLDAVLQEMEDFEPGNQVALNPYSYPEEQREELRNAGYIVDEGAWEEVVGPDGHWGMDFVYEDDFEPWYEKWWDEQNMEHPWYENWKAEHGK
ncbi:MAG: hypothetical protein WBC82_03270 [Dehalococcoidia bacterium]